jgi:hypothetical protein
MFKEIITVHGENRLKRKHALYEQNAVLLFIKAGGTRSYHWTLNG